MYVNTFLTLQDETYFAEKTEKISRKHPIVIIIIIIIIITTITTTLTQAIRNCVVQCFSTSMRPRPGKFFFY